MRDGDVQLAISRPLTLARGVVVPSDDGRLVEVALEPSGELRFVYGGTPERPFDVGSLLVGDDGPGYMGRVLAIRDEGRTRWVTLEPVGLDEIVEDGAFEASFDLADRFVDAGGGVPDVGEVGAVTSELGGRFSLVPGDLFDGAGSCSGAGLAGGVRLSHSLETRSLQTRVVFDREGLVVRRAGVTANGRVATTLTLEADGQVDVRCMVDVLEVLRSHGVRLPERVWVRRLRVGPLPLVVRITLTPRLDAEATLRVDESRVTATFGAHAELTLGAMYEDGGFAITRELDRDARARLAVEGPSEAFAEARIHAGVALRLEANLLQLPELGAGLDAHAWIRTEAEECGYLWEASVGGRVYARGPVGVDLGFFSHTFATLAAERAFEVVARGGDGRLPWCERARGCAEATSCAACNALGFEGCGWCPGEGCLPVGVDGHADGCEERPLTRAASCVDCSGASSELSCGRTSECAWCPELGECVNAAWCVTIPESCGSLLEGRVCEAEGGEGESAEVDVCPAGASAAECEDAFLSADFGDRELLDLQEGVLVASADGALYAAEVTVWCANGVLAFAAASSVATAGTTVTAALTASGAGVAVAPATLGGTVVLAGGLLAISTASLHRCAAGLVSFAIELWRRAVVATGALRDRLFSALRGVQQLVNQQRAPAYTAQQVNRDRNMRAVDGRVKPDADLCRPDAETLRRCSSRVNVQLDLDRPEGRTVQRLCRGDEAVYVCRKVQRLMSLGNNRRLRVHAASGTARVPECANHRQSTRATTDFNDSYAAHNGGDRSKTAEHIIDLQFGGLNEIANLVALGRECNNALGDFMSRARTTNVSNGQGVGEINQCQGAEIRFVPSASLRSFCDGLGISLPSF
ncbi:MAG: hypothetical protein KF901_30000 [Myxococcales bacterium]|nr:hypothetical protein [Myxococcales bacterium]